MICWNTLFNPCDIFQRDTYCLLVFIRNHDAVLFLVDEISCRCTQVCCQDAISCRRRATALQMAQNRGTGFQPGQLFELPRQIQCVVDVQAKRLIDMGFKLGFGGALTYPRATRLQALVKQLPLESICLETDAPDQPSSGFAGKRNEPLALLEVLETVAKLHNTSIEIIAQHTTDNTYSALNIC